MKKYIIWIICLFFMAISLAKADLFPPLAIKTKGQVIYEARRRDNNQWFYTSFISYKKYIKNKTAYFKFVFHLKEKNKFTTVTSIFKNNKYLLPVKSTIITGQEKIITDKEVEKNDGYNNRFSTR